MSNAILKLHSEWHVQTVWMSKTKSASWKKEEKSCVCIHRKRMNTSIKYDERTWKGVADDCTNNQKQKNQFDVSAAVDEMRTVCINSVAFAYIYVHFIFFSCSFTLYIHYVKRRQRWQQHLRRQMSWSARHVLSMWEWYAVELFTCLVWSKTSVR